jgi:glycosyltransferase involved in cell wall biosynthesis
MQPRDFSNTKIKVAWLAPYPIQLLETQLSLSRPAGGFHPCSWIINLSNAIAHRADVELHLIFLSHLISKQQTVSHNGIVFHVLKRGIPFTNHGFPHWLPLDAMTAFALDRHEINKTLRQIAPDIVHAHGTERSLALAAVDSKLPHLISIQGIITEYCKTNPSFLFRLVGRLERQTVKRATFFSCRTAFDTHFVRTLNRDAKIFQICEAMHPVYFDNQWLAENKDTLLYVGSLETRKGLPTLLEAMRLVLQHRPAATLMVIGGGALAQHQNQCAALGISDHVRFVGFQQPETIARHHRDSQLFVLPSDNENSPNSLAEAMVSGLPVVATSVGGIPSMVQDKVTGFLVPPRSPKQLAEIIITLLNNPRLRQEIGDQARRVARARHWPPYIAEQTVAAYQEILSTKPHIK